MTNGVDQSSDLRLIEIFASFGRMVIGSFFIAKSSGLILSGNELNQVFEAGLIPGFLVWCSVGFEFIAAFCVLVGFQTALAAGVLALHVFWTTFIFNYDPGNLPAISLFWKDLAMVGGLIMVIAFSRYGLSADRFYRPEQAATDDSAAEDRTERAPVSA